MRDFAARPICMISPLAGDADDNVDQCVIGSRRAVTLRAIAISPDLKAHRNRAAAVAMPEEPASALPGGPAPAPSQPREAADLHLFHVARDTFRQYLAKKEELLWRVSHLLRPSDKLRKAIERCPSLSPFQSCADNCAADYAHSRADRKFPGFESFIDVFYGNCWLVPTRIQAWGKQELEVSNAWFPRRRPPRALTLMDRTLLRDLGSLADDFMRQVRSLPHFRPEWNAREVRSGIFAEGNLNRAEKKFRKNFTAAEQLLAARPLCPQDRYDVLLCFQHQLPPSVARDILNFTF